ncbi:hypothetical protein FRB99_004107 [Tulasnella sp. 403]|nr:hypothetical protein FRB99_004107 [Tulasnella sp. 403]
MDQSKTLIQSKDFELVLNKALGFSIDLFMDYMEQNVIPVPEKAEEGEEGRVEEGRIRLAAMLPGVARWSHTAVMGMPNALIEGISHLPEVSAFSAIIFSSYEELFTGHTYCDLITNEPDIFGTPSAANRILCANRDEFLDRPTAPAKFHSFEPIVPKDLLYPSSAGFVLSGRDREAGGTWLGVNRAGKVALLTNITEPYGKYETTRGELTSSYLLSTEPLDEYVARLTDPGSWKSYAGFNMLLLEPCTIGSLGYRGQYVSNGGGGGVITSRPLDDDEIACGGITNGIEALDGRSWPKLVQGKKLFSELLDKWRDEPETMPTEGGMVELLSTLLKYVVIGSQADIDQPPEILL